MTLNRLSRPICGGLFVYDSASLVEPLGHRQRSSSVIVLSGPSDFGQTIFTSLRKPVGECLADWTDA